ncbi:antitrypsin-like [Arctopsyche grandis]|uniref:antitrypsin-like n=1 Tax=Arctopsyche grandis TaxID=121162 RepID=UPI00406D90AB
MKTISELFFIYTFLFTSVVSIPNEVEETQNAINRFSLEFYKEATNKNANKNLVVSPISAEVLLGLLSTGARGKTQKELNNAIHLPNSEIIKSTFHSTIEKHSGIPGVVLNVANKIYVKKGASFKLASVFKSIATDHFNAGVQNIDFSNKEKASSTINAWVESKTNNKIKDFISPETLDPETRVMLVNAIYFQGNWSKPFDMRSVHKWKFYKSMIDQMDVDMMFKIDEFPYAHLPEWDADILSLPYKNNDTYLAIILPRKIDGLETLEEKLYSVNIAEVLNKMRETRVC